MGANLSLAFLLLRVNLECGLMVGMPTTEFISKIKQIFHRVIWSFVILSYSLLAIYDYYRRLHDVEAFLFAHCLEFMLAIDAKCITLINVFSKQKSPNCLLLIVPFVDVDIIFLLFGRYLVGKKKKKKRICNFLRGLRWVI